MSGSVTFTLHLAEDEKRLLMELIDSAEQEGIQGLDHTDARSFKNILRSRLSLLESLRTKLERLTLEESKA